MTNNWPSFVTKDLGGPTGEWTEADDAEMHRRWEVYAREMHTLIASGNVHQDEDGWWIDNATGELIGPDPDLERPLSGEELALFRPLSDAEPGLYASIQRNKGGRPRLANPKKLVTIRLDADVVERLKAECEGWQTRANEMLRKAVGL